jgi:Mg-chelatase subunit ChlD
MLWLLAILPILGILMKRARRKQNEAAAKLRGRKKSSKHWNPKTALQLASLTLLIVALARPVWNPHPGPLNVQGRDLVIALDISRSMLAADVFPSRLEAVKISLFESIDALRGQRLGLITFAGSASMRVPLTLDHNFLRFMLERAAPSDADVGSTSLQAAIEKALDTALSESKKGEQDIILFTDGEDYLSDIDATAEQLRDSGARILIVGLGDPIAGAPIPEIGNPDEWMKDRNGDTVITRLDEEKILRLSGSPNVTYYPAHTRPFDMIALYRQMITDTADLPVSDETQLVYTEGYPLFIALALLLWLLPLNKRLFPALALLMMAGCSPDPQPEEDQVPPLIEKARTAWAEAQTSIDADPRAAVFSLESTRAELLQAAMEHPGDLRIAQQIAGLSLQIRDVTSAVKAQEDAEKDLQQKLEEAIELLTALTQRESDLQQISQNLLRRRPPAPVEEKAAAVTPARDEQVEIEKGTGEVFTTVTEVQVFIRKALEASFGKTETPTPTEFDDTAALLQDAQLDQQAAIQSLLEGSANWAKANSAFLGAKRKMQSALQRLSNQQQQNEGDSESDMSDDEDMDWDFEEDMEWSESDMASDMSMPMGFGQFQTALENRSLPVPNYTAEEIMMEEAANMEKRAEQQSKAGGANVEKNW